MGGICGFLFANRAADAESRVRAMAAALEPRGPDEEGFLVQEPRVPGLALGMRRLSITDLERGHPSIWNESRDIAVIFDGALYNRRELRERLALSGHRFSTHTDTEILAHAWEEWGEDCLPELRGMFAFALLHLRQRYSTVPVLFLARDPLGIKPIYYAQTSEGFAFASEVRALLAAEVVARSVSLDALASYLLFGSVVEPVTMIDGAYSLPPGHGMLVHVPERRRVPRARPWWDPAQSPAGRDTRKPRDLPSATECLRPLLDQAVRSHLIADVPTGVLLSGGLDSAAIAVLAARARPGIASFTVAFPDMPSQAALARQVAQRCGTQHTEVPLDSAAALALLDEALAALDQPSFKGIHAYFVSWAARASGLRVALSGLGGDELFAAGPAVRDAVRLEKLIRFSRFIPAVVRRATAGLLPALLPRGRAPDAGRRAVSAWLSPHALPHPYFFARAVFPVAELHALTAARLRPSSIAPDGVTLEPTWLGWLERVADHARRLDRLAALSWLELRCYLANTLLRDMDSVSMSRSFEVRTPLLDTPIVEFVLSLPDSARWRPGTQKILLTEALAGTLPPESPGQRQRTSTLPWESWLRGPLRSRVEASFADLAPTLAPHLHANGVRAEWRAFLTGKTSWSRPWSLYVLNEWCRRNL